MKKFLQTVVTIICIVLTTSLNAQISYSDDFEGGIFETIDCDTPRSYDLRKGEMIMFPSFLMHRVTPVTRGTRRSLVVWVEGPNFK